MALTGYKLLRKRKDGTYGPLFINARQRLSAGITYHFEEHKTKGYAFRPGWHIMSEPVAPHLSTKNRVWCEVEFEPMAEIHRPVSQGGLWYLGRSMTIVKEI